MPYKNREDHKAYERKTPKHVHMYRAAKHRAKVNGLEFNLEHSDIVIPEYCPILGIKIEPNSGKRHPSPSSPNLDRIDNTKGYIKGNVAVISSRANMCKSFLTLEQIEKLYLYSKGMLNE